MDWQPITDRAELEEGLEHIVVGWWVDMPGAGHWWEVSDDWLTECATHFLRLPRPPAFVRQRDTDGSPQGPDPQGLDGEAATAGAEGIAQSKGPSS